ncbi:hypothetical protein RC1_3982 [Rhodospirillum centenum SW]|uniref:Uncharacterized protein n=1 Tax=Rhodospirillum centenum (strain ATCC 51521 / SW) TaxID=414684 RepID=B6IYE9_RHOCS|nr:hypothetical protein RC1_3982 [Rhodospirillum centenum SW]
MLRHQGGGGGRRQARPEPEGGQGAERERPGGRQVTAGQRAHELAAGPPEAVHHGPEAVVAPPDVDVVAALVAHVAQPHRVRLRQRVHRPGDPAQMHGPAGPDQEGRQFGRDAQGEVRILPPHEEVRRGRRKPFQRRAGDQGGGQGRLAGGDDAVLQQALPVRIVAVLRPPCHLRRVLGTAVLSHHAALEIAQGRGRRQPVQRPQQGLQAVRIGQHVIVHHPDPVRPVGDGIGHALPEAARRTAVGIEPDIIDTRQVEPRRQKTREGAVGGAVVQQDDAVHRPRLGLKRPEGEQEQLEAVVRHDKGGDRLGHAGWVRVPDWRCAGCRSWRRKIERHAIRPCVGGQGRRMHRTA